MKYGVAVFFGALFILPSVTSAHVLPYGTVSTELDVQGKEIALQTAVSQNVNGYGHTQEEARAAFEKYFSEHMNIFQNGALCPFTLIYFDPSFDAPQSAFRGSFSCPAPIESLAELSIHSDLFIDAFQNFDHFVIVTVNGERYELPFSAAEQDFPGKISAKSLGGLFDYFLVVALKFIWMGMLHIFTGYDHILFLISVVLLARSVKKILLLVTSFTLAHSVTLLLAGFHILTLSSRIVEPAIAATILFMAVRNIMSLRRGGEVPHEHRVSFTFAFGLIHGLGFAGALADTTIPQIFFVPALLSFNVGIELGQLSILAVILPLLWLIDRSSYRAKMLTVFSFAVCALAAFWILERIFLG